MAKALIIKAETEKQSVQYIGDLIGVYPDTHIFSDDELALFNTLIINGSVEDVQARINQLTPVQTSASKWDSDNIYHFDNVMPPEGVNILDIIEVYQSGKRWYRKTTGFKYSVNVANLTPEEKQLLESIDINNPSIDSFIKKIIKDLTTQDGNNVEVVDLRNTNP